MSVGRGFRNQGVVTDVNNLETHVGVVFEKTDNICEREIQTENEVTEVANQTELQTSDKSLQTVPQKVSGVGIQTEALSGTFIEMDAITPSIKSRELKMDPLRSSRTKPMAV